MPAAAHPPRFPALRWRRAAVFAAFTALGGGVMGLNAGCSRLFGASEEEDAGSDAGAKVVDASPVDAADAIPPPDARAEQERLAIADAGRFCGERGFPDCPLQLWMKQNATTMITFGETTTLSEVFDQIAMLAPPQLDRTYPFPNWVSIARDGADASRIGNLAAAKAACRGCHLQYQIIYHLTLRGRPLPALRGGQP